MERVNLVVHQMVKLQHIHVTNRHGTAEASPVRPSMSIDWPLAGNLPFFSRSLISFSEAPSTGLATLMPSAFAAQPKCVSRSDRRSYATARPRDSARSPPVYHQEDTACPLPATRERRHPCCRGGRPSCRRLDLALHRDIDLDELDHARRQFVTPLEASDLLVVERLKNFDLLLCAALHILQFLLFIRIAENDIAHRLVGETLQDLCRELAFFFRMTSPLSGSIRSRPTTLPSKSFELSWSFPRR